MIMIGHEAISITNSVFLKKFIQSIDKELIIFLREENFLFIHPSVIDVIDITGSNRDDSFWHTEILYQITNILIISINQFVNPESGFDSGFLHLSAFRADTGFQKAKEARCEECT